MCGLKIIWLNSKLLNRSILGLKITTIKQRYQNSNKKITTLKSWYYTMIPTLVLYLW